jgi:hypothetical protein
MPKPVKGQKTPGSGRKKGTPNKATIGLQAEIESLLGKSLPAALFERLGELEAKDYCHAILDLMSYIYPKRKAIEHSGKIDQRFIQEAEALYELSDSELAEIAKEEIAKKK